MSPAPRRAALWAFPIQLAVVAVDGLKSTPPPTPNQPYSAIDTHVHNSDISNFDYTYPQSFPALAGRNWTIGDYTDDWSRASTIRVDGAVLMSLEKRNKSKPVAIADGRFLQSIANRCNVKPTPARCTPVLGIVTGGPLELGGAETADYLRELTSASVAPLTKGIRRPLWKDPPSLWLGPPFVSGVRAVGDAGLVFDVLCVKEQLRQVVQLMKAAPQTRFNIDHLAYPDVHDPDPHTFNDWAGAIDDAAALPNAYMKLSGMPQMWGDSNATQWPTDAFVPYVKKVISAFGANRVNFAGNWFVLKNFGDFAPMATLTVDVLRAAGATEAEMEMIFTTTARKLYNL